MSYQEIIIRNKMMSAEQLKAKLESKFKKSINESLISFPCAVKIKKDIQHSSKVIMFGEEVDLIKQFGGKGISLQKGTEFLCVAGERGAIRSLQRSFGFLRHLCMESFDIDVVVNCDQNPTRKYEDLFTDIALG